MLTFHDGRSTRHAPSFGLPLAALTFGLGTMFPGTASALEVTLSLDDGDALVSRTECNNRSNEEIRLDWTLDSASGSSVEILASNASGCSETDATTAVLVEGLSTSQTSYPSSGDTPFTVSDVLDASGKSPGTCDGSDFRTYACVRLIDSSGNEVATGSAALKFQLERPPPPTSVKVTPGENALHVSWSTGSATTSATASSEQYQVYASAGGTTVSSDKTTSTSLRLGGLANETTYNVWVVAYSEAGNASDSSDDATGTPAPVDDFYEVYVRDGGEAQGGCNTAAASESALAAAAVLFLVALLVRARRRRRRAAGAVLAVLLLSAARAVRAEGSVELGVGSYRPSIDEKLQGSATPYADVFGTGQRPMFLLTASWAALAGAAGRLELGVRSGFFRASGHGQFADGTQSQDATTLGIVPTSLVFTGRLHLARLGVPLEPYARAALERYNWWVTDGTGKATKRGATHGFSGTAGLAFSLGALDSEGQRGMENEIGLTDLSVYAEATMGKIDGLGARHSWDLSPHGVSFAGGLRVAF